MLQDLSQIIRQLQRNELNKVVLRNRRVNRHDDLVALVEALKVNQSLTSLDLQSNFVGETGTRALAEALNVNSSLTSLDLLGNFTCDNGAIALAHALTINQNLASINLAHNGIGVQGAKALAEMLKANTSLTIIGLSGNTIGDEGANALAEALKINARLTLIKLTTNQIGAEGAEALAQALKVNQSLTSIRLTLNTLGDEGAIALAQGLKINRSLTSIDLDFNKIGDEGAKALAEMLKANTSLTEMTLAGNKIGDEGVKALLEMLEVNTSLTKINLASNNQIINKGILSSIKGLLERNKRIAEFKRLAENTKQFNLNLNNELNVDELNQQLASLEELLETLKDYPLIYKSLEALFHSVYATVYLKQQDIVSALSLFQNLSEDNEMMHALGEQIYALDPEDELLERVGLSQDDKTKAALAVLGRAFEKRETQALLKRIALDILPSSNPELGVSLLIPEDALVTQLTSLPGDAGKEDLLHQLESMTPQALYDYCQQEPIKQALERAFGSSSIASLESILRHGDKFPVISHASSYVSEGKQEADDDAATVQMSTTKRPTASSKLFEPSLQALLDYAKKFKRQDKEIVDVYRHKIIQQIVNYRHFKGSLRDWKISDSRQKPGFFTRWRHHGAEGFFRAQALTRDIETAPSIAAIDSVMAKFLQDKNTPYHQNSLSSFVLDALVELDSPWHGLAIASHYSRQEIRDRCDTVLETTDEQPAQTMPQS